MSLMTRCPTCSTMFKIVPDQLRISEGWVRCGHCNEVFDANVQLQSAPPEALASAVEEPTGYDWGAILGTASATASHPAEPSPVAPVEMAQPEAPTLDTPLQVLSVEFQPLNTQFENHAVTADFLDVSPGADWGAGDSNRQLSETTTRQSYSVSSEENIPDISNAVSFLTPARPTKKKGAWRVALGAVVGILVVVLLAQVLANERHRIVAGIPGAKVVADAFCSALGCEVLPLKQIESVLIDSSSFSKSWGNVYRLNLTLKNTAAVSVALPAIELTLTDAQDQAIVRRVISVPELGQERSELESGGEWAVSQAVELQLPSGSTRISGYRLLAFYP